MNVDMLKRLAEECKSMGIYSDPRFPPSLYYRFLKLLTKTVQPDMSVELGVCGGGGLLHMALGWPDGRAVGFEIGNEYPDNLVHLLEVCPNATVIKGDSRYDIAGACWSGKFTPGCVGVLFIDTVHEYDHVTAELKAWMPYLANDAVVCLDDLYRERMLDFWNELPYEKVRLDFLHPSQSPTDGGFGAFIVR